MKTQFPLTLLLALAFSLPAFAHDPSLHKHKDAKADCSKMKDMDTMDMNDPVMKAMHEKCKDHTTHDTAGMKKTPPPTDKDRK